MMVTFGVGWLKPEFDLLGVPFHRRGRIADAYLAAIIELWTSQSPCFAGSYVSFHDVAFEPKPVQKPHLPVWIGGDADAALKRAARFASGWWPFLTRRTRSPSGSSSSRANPATTGARSKSCADWPRREYLDYAQWVIEEIKPNVG